MYNKEGFRKQDSRQEGSDEGKHRETICGCQVRMDIAVTPISQIGCE